MSHNFLLRLRSALATNNRPGVDAQLSMAHIGRRDLVEATETSRRAAVMALFYPREKTSDDLNLIFIRRSSHEPRDRHAGQIGFPGGSVEPADAHLQATALRETYEEIGVDPGRVEVLGKMTDLFIPISNFLVTPFIGFTPSRPDYILQASEVAELIEVPFSDFFRASARQVSDRKIASGLRLKDVPYWQVGNVDIWGATAMMTSEIVALLDG
ncbi:coenzyme A pyrophosphatase [Lewinellaceae bacterium SD302]|nr:coenzyme A pyrophosphatase [Lewinellaceae bacterium SD302]